MIRVKNGDQAAFRELYEAHKEAIMSFVYQMVRNSNLAEELTQEVFLRVYRDRQKYEATAGFRTYVFTIARNLCLDHLRSPKSKEEFLEDYQIEAIEGDSEADQALLQRTDRSQIEECLEKLKPEQKECLLHRTVSEMSYEEIGQVTGLSLPAVKTHIFRGKEALKECVQKKVVRGEE
ncbi:MAG: RNA polymerase sigma factor [Bdellovibrionia bacterium]